MPPKPSSSSSTKRRRHSPANTTSTTCSTRSASVTDSRSNNSTDHRTPEDHAPSRPRGDADDESTLAQNDTETPTSLPPKQLFLVGSNNVQTIGDEITVSSLVAKRIFPHVKFVRNPVEELAFTNDAKSICGIVRAHCNPPENIPATDWWQSARKWVGRQIAIQRSSKNTKLKWTFMGTYVVLLSLLIIFTNLLFVQFG